MNCLKIFLYKYFFLNVIAPFFTNWNPFKNKKVAIVGNAESLFSKRYGEIIDQHDVICRFNCGNLIVNKVSQGNKTDVYFFNVPSNPFFSKYISKEIKSVVHISNKDRHKKLCSIETIFIPKMFNLIIRDLARVNRPSSGLMALNYIEACKPASLSIFGFDWKATPTYYDKNRINEPHNYENERDYVFKNILSKKNYEIYN